MHKILENPIIHNIVQKILLIGRTRALRNTEEAILENCNHNVLDIGCGTGRYAHLLEYSNYVGIDINFEYLRFTNFQMRRKFTCGNGVSLPFKNRCFDSVFSVGFFHHIDSESSKGVFKEVLRVSKPSATFLFIDIFYPDNKVDILGSLICKLDRGKHIRRKEIFLDELNFFFELQHSYHIKYSYPYNLNAFVLRAK